MKVKLEELEAKVKVVEKNVKTEENVKMEEVEEENLKKEENVKMEVKKEMTRRPKEETAPAPLLTTNVRSPERLQALASEADVRRKTHLKAQEQKKERAKQNKFVKELEKVEAALEKERVKKEKTAKKLAIATEKAKKRGKYHS